MSEVVLKIENVSKQYRLGLVGTGTLSHDLKRWWYLIRGKEDPFLKVGEVNEREIKGGEYVNALSDINLEIKKGEVVGIIGKNGAGKSTLLKLLSEVTTPTTGSIKMKGRIAALLEVGTGFHPELTGRENIYLNGAILGMTKKEINSKIEEIIDFSGVAKYVDTPVKRYSSGMKVRLGFAVAAHLEPEAQLRQGQHGGCTQQGQEEASQEGTPYQSQQQSARRHSSRSSCWGTRGQRVFWFR